MRGALLCRQAGTFSSRLTKPKTLLPISYLSHASNSTLHHISPTITNRHQPSNSPPPTPGDPPKPPQTAPESIKLCVLPVSRKIIMMHKILPRCHLPRRQAKQNSTSLFARACFKLGALRDACWPNRELFLFPTSGFFFVPSEQQQKKLITKYKRGTPCGLFGAALRFCVFWGLLRPCRSFAPFCRPAGKLRPTCARWVVAEGRPRGRTPMSWEEGSSWRTRLPRGHGALRGHRFLSMLSCLLACPPYVASGGSGAGLRSWAWPLFCCAAFFCLTPRQAMGWGTGCQAAPPVSLRSVGHSQPVRGGVRGGVRATRTVAL